MAKSIGTGILFQDIAKAVFVRITGQRYDAMLRRVERKGFPGLPFTKDEFRECVLVAIGGTYDGFRRCQYCTGFFTVEDIAIDHAVPLGRGGGVGLDNLAFPCQRCNGRKGNMTPTEYMKLLEFLNDHLPLAKTDVLKRLEMSVKLAAGARSNAATIEELKESGEWQRVKKTQRQAKRAKESGLGAF